MNILRNFFKMIITQINNWYILDSEQFNWKIPLFFYNLHPCPRFPKPCYQSNFILFVYFSFFMMNFKFKSLSILLNLCFSFSMCCFTCFHCRLVGNNVTTRENVIFYSLWEYSRKVLYNIPSNFSFKNKRLRESHSKKQITGQTGSLLEKFWRKF